MNWWLVLYAVAGVPLVLWISYEEKGYLTTNDWLMAVLFGWLIGVPVVVISLVCFGNWPVIVRNVWRFLCWPVRAYRSRAATHPKEPTEAPAQQE
jgi:hypothetical protein